MTLAKLTVFVFLQFVTVIAYGQIQDTIIKADSINVTSEPKGPVKDSARLAIEAMPRKAALRSAILPGLGQYYNGGLWWIKVPVIYGGFGTLIGVYMWNQNNYKLFLGEAQYRLANNNEPRDPRYAFYDYQAIIQIKDIYRRDRDLTIIGMAGWYAINIIEAYVDAKFFRFDVSEELSLKVTPAVQPGSFSYAGMTAAPGLKLTLSFKKPPSTSYGGSSTHIR